MDPLAFCKQLVRQRSFDAYCSYLFLEPELRPLAWALGAFNIETSDIKVVSKSKMAALGRFTFWKEQIDKGLSLRGNPVISLLNNTLSNKTKDLPLLMDVINAKEEDVLKDNYLNMEEIEAYGQWSTGNTLRILSQDRINLEKIEYISAGLMLVRFLRAAPHLCSMGIDPGFPISLLNKEKIDPDALLGPWPPGITNVIKEMSIRAQSKLQNALEEKNDRAFFLETIPAVNFLRRVKAQNYRLNQMSTKSSPLALLSTWRAYHFGYKIEKNIK